MNAHDISAALPYSRSCGRVPVLFPDLDHALTPFTEGIPDNVGYFYGLPTIPTAAYLAAESISPTTGPGREGKKMLRLEHVWQNMVCAMKCGVAPSQPTDEHHPITAIHQF